MLTKKVLASYSAVSLPLAAMAMPMAVYLPPFYAEADALDLTTVGLIFTLARIWDVITDPLMGMAIDKFESRWGRRKHWVAISIPILLISVYMVYLPDPADITPLYLGGWLLLLYVGYTMLGIAHQSWGADLTTTYDDRSRIFGWREFFVIAGMTLVLALPAGVDFLGDGDSRTKLLSMGMFCLILFPVTVLPTLLFVPDKRSTQTATTDWFQALKIIAGNRTLWRLLIVDFAFNFGTTASATLYIFMASYVFELPSHASFALLLYFLSSFFAMPLWLKLAYSLGKDLTLRIALAYAVLMKFLLFVLAEPGSVAVFWGYTILYGTAFGAGPTLLRSMMADVTDVDQVQTGRQRAGLFFALLTTTNKVGSAIAVSIAFIVIDAVYGFVPGGTNSEAAVDGLLATYCFLSAIGFFLAFFPLMKYPLDKEEHAKVRAQLEVGGT